MLKLCVPVSSAFFEKEMELLPLVDALELKKIEEYVPDKKELICHLNGFIDLEFVENLKKGSLFDYLTSMKVHYLSFDLGPSCLRYRIGESGVFIAEGEILNKEQIISIAAERLNFIRDNFQGALAFENLDYNNTGAYEHVCEPEFISRAVEYFDIGFLLDIAHAKVSALKLGYSLSEYIDSLPLSRVVEVHISHAGYENGVICDLHELPTEEDFQILRSILKKTQPQYLTCEYRRDSNLLVEVYRSLRREVDDFNKRGNSAGRGKLR